MVNLTNPKVILFILAFVPQFVDPARPVLPQFLVFGAVLSLGRAGGERRWSASFAGGIGQRLARSPRVRRGGWAGSRQASLPRWRCGLR